MTERILGYTGCAMLLLVLISCVSCTKRAIVGDEVEFGPPPQPPINAPTLNYEEIAGFDPATQALFAERERLTALESRLDRLEAKVEQLNHILGAIPTQSKPELGAVGD